MPTVWERGPSLASVALGALWKLSLSHVSADLRTII